MGSDMGKNVNHSPHLGSEFMSVAGNLSNSTTLAQVLK